MVSNQSKYLAIGLFLASTLSNGLTYRSEMSHWIKTDCPERELRGIDTLTIGSYNVENLFRDAVVPPFDDVLKILPIMDGNTPIKPVTKIKDLSRAILEIDYDILVVSEIENLQTLELLNEYYLNKQYQAFLIEGNDARGIDVGFFVKKNLPYYILEETNKTETWKDPTHENEVDLLFSRDIPELHIRESDTDDPIFVLLGTHYKSKISRKGDVESRILRKAQVERTAEIFQRLSAQYGSDLPLFIGGDFNGEVSHEPEFVAFKKAVELFDAFDSVKPPVPQKERFTHLYFPKDAPYKRSQLDGFMFDYHANQAIREAYVYRYKDPNGTLLPVPTTYKEKNNLLPSDHYPVVVQMDPNAFVE